MTNSSLSPCGVICDLCLGFQRSKNTCVGCLVEGKKPYHCTVCSIKSCPEKQSNPAALCSACPNYSCRRLKDLNKRYTPKYGENLHQNLTAARNDGLDSFIKAAEQKWRCPQRAHFPLFMYK